MSSPDIRLFALKGFIAMLRDFLAGLFRRAAPTLSPAEQAQALVDAGLALGTEGAHHAALAHFEEAVRLAPEHALAQYNMGAALTMLGRAQEACDYYRRAIALRPDFAVAQFGLALNLLRQGDFAQGWAGYEMRRYGPTELRTFDTPAWTGEEHIAGKTLLIFDEQGYGDTIQFCRYLPLVAQKGAQLVFLVQEPLRALMASLDGNARLIVDGEPLPPIDLHCPLMSLPRILGMNAHNVPSREGYLHACPQRIEKWRARLPPPSGRLRIGLAWRGNPQHMNDHWRNVPLRDLLACLLPEHELVSLQRALPAADEALLAQNPQIRHFGEALEDFADTAALCALMDHVVSVDTASAHLAGALGKPFTVLLPANSEWRWLTDRADSPWYAYAQLLRQEHLGDWSPVLAVLPERLMGDRSLRHTPLAAPRPRRGYYK
jgi:tetratricopeptide (TPR) repeat protein